jgi:TrmH family RNA methyltransferase
LLTFGFFDTLLSPGMEEFFTNIRIVLQNPKEGFNIGSVCRAMMNMNLLNLDIVSLNSFDQVRVKTLAVHAFEVYQNALFHTDLASAVRNSSLIAGITRRQGRKRKYVYYTPEELAQKIAQNRPGLTSLVFGNEEGGLTDQELELCHMAVTIPTSPLFPSLNLSHAVQIVAYELYKALSAAMPEKERIISGERLGSVVESIIESLSRAGFFTKVTPRTMTNFFKDILSRAMLSETEAERMEGVFMKIRGLVGKKRGDSASGPAFPKGRAGK